MALSYPPSPPIPKTVGVHRPTRDDDHRQDDDDTNSPPSLSQHTPKRDDNCENLTTTGRSVSFRKITYLRLGLDSYVLRKSHRRPLFMYVRQFQLEILPSGVSGLLWILVLGYILCIDTDDFMLTSCDEMCV